jgi:hypothetical protein
MAIGSGSWIGLPVSWASRKSRQADHRARRIGLVCTLTEVQMLILFALGVGAAALLGVGLETKLNSNAQRRKADKAVGEASLARLREQVSRATKERERLEREYRQAGHALQDVTADLARGPELANRAGREYRQAGHAPQDVTAGVERGDELANRAGREYRQADRALQDVTAGVERGDELANRAGREYRQAGHAPQDVTAGVERGDELDLKKDQARDLIITKTRELECGGRSLSLGL